MGVVYVSVNLKNRASHLVMKGILLFFLVFTSSNLVGQDFKKQYRQAKDLFEAAQYSQAMDAFQSLTIYDSENPYPEYASFYYALSAHRMGFTTVAKDMLLQIKRLYPTWDQQDEVNFLLAKIYFDQREIFQGMRVALSIENKNFKQDIENLKKSSLANVSDAETLKMLLEDFPNDEVVAKNLARALSKLEFPNQELMYLDSIITRYNLPREEYITEATLKPIFKNTYTIALLFPFLAETLDPSPVRKKNQVVLEIYEGMKLAADTLAGEGINIKLLGYDTERNQERIEKLLKEEELKSVDLIVGPIYVEGQTEVQEFSMQHKINLVASPLSNNSDQLTSPYALLFQPSHETIGIKSAELVAEKTTNKNCFVYYGESPKDSVMAFNFIKRALELGINVVMAEEIRRENSGRILTTLATATEYDEWKNPIQFKLKRDSLGSIFVASSDPLIYTKVINSAETRADSMLVVGQETWLEDGTIDLRKFERIRIAFASPNYSSFTSDAYQVFRKAYIKKHSVLPSGDAKIGYEFVMTMGRILNQFGVNFQPFLLEAGFQKGTLTSGFQLMPFRDNGKVPFTAFRDGELVLIKE